MITMRTTAVPVAFGSHQERLQAVTATWDKLLASLPDDDRAWFAAGGRHVLTSRSMCVLVETEAQKTEWESKLLAVGARRDALRFNTKNGRQTVQILIYEGVNLYVQLPVPRRIVD